MSSITMAADSTQSELKEHLKGRKQKKKEGTRKKKKKDKKRKTDNDSDSDCESDLDLKRELKPIGGYIRDRELTVAQMFRSISRKKLKAMLPEILKPIPVDDLKKLCIEQLDCMSRKRIRRILQGADPETISSSGTEEDSSLSDCDKPRGGSDEDIHSDNAVNSTSPKEDNSYVAVHSDAFRSPVSYASRSRSRSPLSGSDQSKVNSRRSSYNLQAGFSDSDASKYSDEHDDDDVADEEEEEIMEEVVYEEIVLEDGEDLESILGRGSYMKGTKDSRLRTVTAHEIEDGEEDDVIVIEREEREENADVIMVEDEEDAGGATASLERDDSSTDNTSIPSNGSSITGEVVTMAEEPTADGDSPLTGGELDNEEKTSDDIIESTNDILSMRNSDADSCCNMDITNARSEVNIAKRDTKNQTDADKQKNQSNFDVSQSKENVANQDKSVTESTTADTEKELEVEKDYLEVEDESTASSEIKTDDSLHNAEVTEDPVTQDQVESDKDDVTSTMGSTHEDHRDEAKSQSSTNGSDEVILEADKVIKNKNTPPTDSSVKSSPAGDAAELVLEVQDDSILNLENDHPTGEDPADDNLNVNFKTVIKSEENVQDNVKENVDNDDISSKKRQREEELEEGELEDTTSEEEPEIVDNAVCKSDSVVKIITRHVHGGSRQITDDMHINKPKKRKIRVIKRIIKVIRRNPNSGQIDLKSPARDTRTKLKVSHSTKQGSSQIAHDYMKVKIKEEPGLTQSAASTSKLSSQEHRKQSKISKSKHSSSKSSLDAKIKQEHEPPKVKRHGQSTGEDSSLNRMEILELEMRARAIKAMLKKQEQIEEDDKPETKKRKIKLKR